MLNKPLKPQSCQTDVSGSAFTIHDLKCGNILNYDTGEEGIAPTVIDWQDLKWLTENPDDFNKYHSPKPLTEDVLKQFGAMDNNGNYLWLLGDIELSWITTDEYFELEYQTPNLSWRILPMRYVHELQNLYYCLTGEMLSLS